jgi:hypothetical protein
VDSVNSLAAELMTGFAERTGLLDATRPPRRYLWTDAFAVCNFLGLAEATAIAASTELALRLMHQVHHVLGRHRPDDSRSGWLSGLSEEEGERHPTRGGLRIGKELTERGPDEPPDSELEWHRDGQYFHYLTRWMHALDRVSRHTGDPTANRWARELAQTAHAAFSYAPLPGAAKRLVWKLSIDLTRPLVSSMGLHDPLDGLLTYRQLEAHRKTAEGPGLAMEIEELARIARGREWWTDDPLGLGGLLTDAYRIAQLVRESVDDGSLAVPVLAAAVSGLDAWLRRRPLELGVEQRLAFRELGISIGLHAAVRLGTELEQHPESFGKLPAVRASLAALSTHAPLIERIESFWLEPRHQGSHSWLAHEDINAVMLATSLAPAGYLGS